MSPHVVVYGDQTSDELLARRFLLKKEFASATVKRLPPEGDYRTPLGRLLQWERFDWVIERDDEILCTVEFTRHGYTGDNGFQRFARLYRSVMLGIPTIYFTPFSRGRLNEINMGQLNPRNVAPELFATMNAVSEVFDVPCLGVAWPTTSTGVAVPFTSASAATALERVCDLIRKIVMGGAIGSNRALAAYVPDLVAAMNIQAAIPRRGTDTRGLIDLPINLQTFQWVLDWLPLNYFSVGKADKALASSVLHNSLPNLTIRDRHTAWEAKMSKATVLYLGYQWRPDPACGLIALSAAQAKAKGTPLVVIWPRVFAVNGERRDSFVNDLTEFKLDGTGRLATEIEALGKTPSQIAEFRSRVSVESNQYGLFSKDTKIARILESTASILVLGDQVLELQNE